LTTSPRVRRDSLASTITVLAELFPAVFVAEPWQPHKPLKRSIHADLVARGVLSEEEVRDVLRAYSWRLGYQRALAAGGTPLQLAGEPYGEVSAQEIAGAKLAVERIEANRLKEALAAKAKAKAAKKPKVTCAPARMSATPPAAPRLSLAGLKAAAQARRAAAAAA
jgi:sRNA-binding protein